MYITYDYDDHLSIVTTSVKRQYTAGFDTNF